MTNRLHCHVVEDLSKVRNNFNSYINIELKGKKQYLLVFHINEEFIDIHGYLHNTIPTSKLLISKAGF